MQRTAMSTYAPKSMLRFYPTDSDAHYTAVILENEKVYQIKSPTNEKMEFDSVEEWLHSLPGSPSADALIVHSAEQENQQVKQVKKEKEKEKKKKFNVPSKVKTRGGNPLKWGRHVYLSMKTLVPSLLEKEGVMDAYNDFIDVLSVPRPNIVIYITGGANSHLHGINLEGYDTIPVHCNVLHASAHQTIEKNKERLVQRDEMIQACRKAYLPLYELIKREMVPLIEQKKRDQLNRGMIAYHTVQVRKVVQKQIRAQEKFDAVMQRMEKNIEYNKKQIQIYTNMPRKRYDWEEPLIHNSA